MLAGIPQLSIYQQSTRLRVERSAARPKAEPLPLDELCEEFVDGYRYTGSPRTLEGYEANMARGWFPWLAAQRPPVLRLDQIEPRHIERYLAEQSAKFAAVSVRRNYNRIHRFFTWCIERQYCTWNPCDVVKAPAVPEGTRQAFGDDEVQRLSRVTNAKTGIIGARDKAMLGVLLDTGARAAELCAMKLADVDWTRHRVLLHGKGAKDRWVPIGNETQRRLALWVRLRYRVPSDALWLTLRRTPMRYMTLSASLEKLGEYAGVADCTPHRFRHSFATYFYRAHKDILALQSLLGHASVEMTTRYLRQLGVGYGAEMAYRPPGEWLLRPE